jgi:mannose/cellobiose epimerase-like protein (N-acyl-D-glucosamine 2-epimerase family)
MEKLTRQQWYELDEQFSRTPSEPFSSEPPGEYMKLIAILNKYGHQAMTKQQALNMARTLLDLGWQEEDRFKAYYSYPLDKMSLQVGN